MRKLIQDGGEGGVQIQNNGKRQDSSQDSSSCLTNGFKLSVDDKKLNSL